jgi:hypothetical protein
MLVPVAFGVGVYVSPAAATRLCNPHVCSEEIAAACAGLSDGDRARCKKSVVNDCRAGNCSCTDPTLPACGVTTTTSPTTSTSSTTTATSSTTSTTSPTTSTSSTTTATSSTTSTTSPTTSTSSTTTATSSTTTTTMMSAGGAFLDFSTSTPGSTCGNTQDASNAVIKNLTCGGLNIGGGMDLVPEGSIPDGSISQFALSCTGSSCTIGPTSTTPPVNSAAPDCTDTNCNFGTPLPIPNPGLPSLSTCVLNAWSAPASGTLDLDTGASSTKVALNSDVYLTGNLGQPCPRCSGTGTPSSPGTGTCDRGPNATMACTTTSSTGATRDCPTGGTDATHPCTPGGGACIDGTHVGVIPIDLSPLETGSASKTAANGIFCTSQAHAGCFGGAGCVTITENGMAAGPVTVGTPASATLASVFCIGATGNGLVDATADLPGPGAIALPGTFLVHN